MTQSLRHIALVVAMVIPSALSGGGWAAQLHEPLPADSTERNGEPRPLIEHKSRSTPPAALPGGGLHPNASTGLARVYSGTPIDVLTYHYDTLRTGWNSHETDLTPAAVASGNFGQLTTLNVDGEVLAQPLIVSNFMMADGQQHNVLLIATAHNSVYAFDAQNYALLWQVNLGASQTSNDIGCADVVPEYGISATPVIVRKAANSATIYLVAATEPAPFSFHTQLRALDLKTGKDLLPPREIAPKAKLAGGHTVKFDPQDQWIRAGLTYANQSIYVAVGAHCDLRANLNSGWLIRYSTGLMPLRAFNTIEGSYSFALASVWMAGFAPSVDRNGNILVVTGNGYYSTVAGAKAYGESVLSLSSDLSRVHSSFTPINYSSLNAADHDFGSGGVMLLPMWAGQKAPPLAVAMGKDPTIYLLNQGQLGGLQGSAKGPLQALSVAGNGVWGGPAYYRTAQGARIFYQSGNDVLRAYTVNDGITPTLSDVVDGTSSGGFSGTIPVVSSQAAVVGTGVVWLVRRGLTEQLEAYDAMKLGTPLFAANAGLWGGDNGGRAYVAPLVANGRVYVSANKTVSVFGLTN
jgi:hypothetical protein